jgi:hypothetical protein
MGRVLRRTAQHAVCLIKHSDGSTWAAAGQRAPCHLEVENRPGSSFTGAPTQSRGQMAPGPRHAWVQFSHRVGRTAAQGSSVDGL